MLSTIGTLVIALNYQSDAQARPKSATMTSTMVSRATTIVVEKPIIETSEPGQRFCDNESDNTKIVQDQFEQVVDNSAVPDEEKEGGEEKDFDNEGEYPVDDGDDKGKDGEEDGSGIVQDQFGYQLPNADVDD